MKIAWMLLALSAMAQEPTRAELERQIDVQRRLLSDWAGLTYYGSDNSEVRLTPGVDRVVFLGDEVTENWGKGNAKFFPGKPYFNRGIAHQTTPQLLVRFRQDVIGLKPSVVVILAGANDLGGAAGPITENMAAENFMSMAELAKVHGIKVVLASVTPIGKNLTARLPVGRILGLNRWLKDYAEKNGLGFIDYYSSLAEGRAIKPEYTTDGMIPSDAGYEKMAPLAEKAIADALSRK